MIGPYEIMERIAPESGQNTIFIVKDTKKDLMCAMKVRKRERDEEIFHFQVEMKEQRSMKCSMLELELWILATMKKKTDASHFCKVDPIPHLPLSLSPSSPLTLSPSLPPSLLRFSLVVHGTNMNS